MLRRLFELKIIDGKPYYVAPDGRKYPALPFSGGDGAAVATRMSSAQYNEMAFFAAFPQYQRAYSMFQTITNPAAAPTVDPTGEFLTISRFLNTPEAVAARIRDIVQQRFIADRILTGRSPTGGGAVLVEQSESLWPNAGEVESRQPGAEYPLAEIGEGGDAEVFVVKDWGLATIVTVEAIRRRLRAPLDRALQVLSNAVIRKVDAAALAVIAAQPVQTLAGADWTSAATDILGQLVTADRMIRTLNEGFEADLLVVDDTRASELILNADIRELLAAGDTGSAGLNRIVQLVRNALVSPNLPVANTAVVADSRVLGGMADEEPLSTDSIFQRERKRWVVIAERVTTPWIQEPRGAVQITGV